MIDVNVVTCPWCDFDFEFLEDMGSEINCPSCGNRCKAWADGDIGWGRWYLVKMGAE